MEKEIKDLEKEILVTAENKEKTAEPVQKSENEKNVEKLDLKTENENLKIKILDLEKKQKTVQEIADGEKLKTENESLKKKYQELKSKFEAPDEIDPDEIDDEKYDDGWRPRDLESKESRAKLKPLPKWKN